MGEDEREEEFAEGGEGVFGDVDEGFLELFEKRVLGLASVHCNYNKPMSQLKLVIKRSDVLEDQILKINTVLAPLGEGLAPKRLSRHVFVQLVLLDAGGPALLGEDVDLANC